MLRGADKQQPYCLACCQATAWVRQAAFACITAPQCVKCISLLPWFQLDAAARKLTYCVWRLSSWDGVIKPKSCKLTRWRRRLRERRSTEIVSQFASMNCWQSSGICLSANSLQERRDRAKKRNVLTKH